MPPPQVEDTVGINSDDTGRSAASAGDARSNAISGSPSYHASDGRADSPGRASKNFREFLGVVFRPLGEQMTSDRLLNIVNRVRQIVQIWTTLDGNPLAQLFDRLQDFRELIKRLFLARNLQRPIFRVGRINCLKRDFEPFG